VGVRDARDAVVVLAMLWTLAAAAPPADQSDTVWDVIGKLGVGVVIGGLSVAIITSLLTGRREKTAARRAWLEQALASFYAPVSTKLEVMYLRSQELEQEVREARTRREGDEGDPPVFPTFEDKMLQRLVQENISTDAELARVIESNLHFVATAELREAALEYLSTAHVRSFHRDVAGTSERLARGHGLIVIPEDPPERPKFHALVREEFQRQSAEFRRLSGGR